MFSTLEQTNSVLEGLRNAAKLAAEAKKTKDGDKMAKVLNLLKGLQGDMLTKPQSTHHVAQPASSRKDGDLAAILTGQAPMP